MSRSQISMIAGMVVSNIMIEFVLQVVGVILSVAVMITWMLIPSGEVQERETFDKSKIKYHDGDNT